jgi:hypothetical protein
MAVLTAVVVIVALQYLVLRGRGLVLSVHPLCPEKCMLPLGVAVA